MRANGVSGFPDPIPGPNGAVGLPLTENADGSLTAEGKSFAGPVLQSAEKTCREYLPGAAGPAPAPTAAQLKQALTFARCMRAHGVPNFPDPDAAGVYNPATISVQAPAFRSAARRCGAGSSGNMSIGR
jgi:hypothetical protein